MPRKSPEQQYRDKKRQLDVGLANNAFGAAAGGVATGAAVGGAKKLWQASKGSPNDPGHIYQQKKELPKWMGKGKGGAPNKVLRWGRALQKIPGPAKVAAGVGGAGLVGMQAVNAGMDAQSAAYFANEKRKLKPPAGLKKEPLKKSIDDVLRFGQIDVYDSPWERGTGFGRDISKATPRGEQREVDRQRRVARNEVLGYAGAGALGLGGAKMVHGTIPWKEKLTPREHFERAAFREMRRKPSAILSGAPKYRPRGKFVGGAALLAAAPAVAYASKKGAERGRERWA